MRRIASASLVLCALLPPLCAIPTPPPVSRLIITEFMSDSIRGNGFHGQWLEVYNPSESQVDLKGFSLSGERNERHVILRNVLVRPRSFALLAYSNHLGDSEHLHVDYIYRCIECPVFRMGQTQGAIAIIDPFGRTVDKVEYGAGWSALNRADYSKQLRSLTADNNDPANWCIAATRFHTGEYGTPGRENDCGVTTSTTNPTTTTMPTTSTVETAPPPRSSVKLVVTEFMPDPTRITDTGGEWFEVFNPTTAPIDMRGFTIGDEGVDRHRVAQSVVVPPRGYALFGVTDHLGGARQQLSVDYVYGLNFRLSNEEDEIVIRDGEGLLVVRLRYDFSLPPPPGHCDDDRPRRNDVFKPCECEPIFGPERRRRANPDCVDVPLDLSWAMLRRPGYSVQLKRPDMDIGDGNNWCLGRSQYHSGDWGTPRAPNDCRGVAATTTVAAATSTTDAVATSTTAAAATSTSTTITATPSTSSAAPATTPSIDASQATTGGTTVAPALSATASVAFITTVTEATTTTGSRVDPSTTTSPAMSTTPSPIVASTRTRSVTTVRRPRTATPSITATAKAATTTLSPQSTVATGAGDNAAGVGVDESKVEPTHDDGSIYTLDSAAVGAIAGGSFLFVLVLIIAAVVVLRQQAQGAVDMSELSHIDNPVYDATASGAGPEVQHVELSGGMFLPDESEPDVVGSPAGYLNIVAAGDAGEASAVGSQPS